MAKKSSAVKPHANKIRTMALSVFLAVIVWFMVMSLTNPSITTTVSNLDVRFVGEMQLRDRQLAITGRKDIPTLSVSVRGSRSDLMSYMDDIYVQVDVSDISFAGSYELSGTISIPTTRISVEKEKYSDIPITVEAVESKDIEVTVKQTGATRGKLISSEIENPIVTITGARSELERVAGAVATVDVSRLRDEHSQRVGYVLTDDTGALITGNETIESKRAEVEVTSTSYEAVTLPVQPVLSSELENMYILDADKTTISPASVTVGINGGSDDNRVTAVIDRPSDDEQDYKVQGYGGIYIPPESEYVKLKPYLIPKETAEIELTVTAENLSDGLSARIENPVTATVSGEAGRVSADNVHAVVDAEGLGKGRYTLPVRLRDDDFSLNGNYTVDVVIE